MEINCVVLSGSEWRINSDRLRKPNCFGKGRPRRVIKTRKVVKPIKCFKATFQRERERERKVKPK